MKTATLAVVLVLITAGIAAAAPTAGGCRNGTGATTKGLGSCVVGSATASGDYAAASAEGTVRQPITIAIIVYTNGVKPIQVTWSMTCIRGTGVGSKSGQWQTHTSGTAASTPTGIHAQWTLRQLPMPMKNADSCSVVGEAQVMTSGTIRVQIMGVRP